MSGNGRSEMVAGGLGLAEADEARRLRLLVLEDSPEDYELMMRTLRRAGYGAVAVRVDSESAFREALEAESWDVVIADHVIPGFAGPKAIDLARQLSPDVALVVVSGKVDEDVIADDLRRGADDYVLKSNLARLPPSLEAARKAAANRRGRREALEALRTSEERYRRIVEGTIEGLLELDADYRIVSVNERWLTMMGYSRSQVVGTRVHDYLFEEDLPDLDANIERRRRGEPGRHERRFRRADGSQMWAIVSAVPKIEDDGSFAGVAALWLDITDRKRLEQQLWTIASRLERTVEGAISAMGATVEMRDPYTAGHERRVTGLAEALAAELGLDEEAREGLRLAGSVHDIGKVAIPAEILSKPGRLQEYELNLVRTHARVGYDILRPIEFSQPVAEIVLQHHERLDGSGYPRGLSGDQILLEARVLAVADVVEAMSSHRPYRPALGLDAALREVREGAGRLYDADVVAACERVMDAGFTFATGG